VEGIAIGDAIAAGPSQVIRDPKDMERFKAGSVLVTEATNPDWVPLMKKSRRDRDGARGAHLPRGHREPGTWACPPWSARPAPSPPLKEGREVTVSCAEGRMRGVVYAGRLAFEAREVPLGGAGRIAGARS
jgi:pyruvate,water dikinase